MVYDVVLRSGFGSYDRKALLDSIPEMIRDAGGWPESIIPGARVLLKVNMLSAKAPERAITTHPELVAAVAVLLQDMGCSVSVGDSPGGAVKGVERYWKNCGFKEIAEELNLDLVNFEASGSLRRSVDGRQYDIARPILDFDAVINMCKFKTHGLCRLTNAVKNGFGAIPGLGKAILHSHAVRPVDFSRTVVDIYQLAGFDMTLMDCILSMDGKGPSTDGTPRWDGILGVARDGVCLDMVMTGLAGLDPLALHTSREARRRGLGKPFEDILVSGADDCILKDFRVPRESLLNLLPPFVGGIARLLFKRPPSSNENCNGCGTCARACPVNAIEIRDGRAVMNRKLCIMCLCCHEMCPEQAVSLKIPLTRS